MKYPCWQKTWPWPSAPNNAGNRQGSSTLTALFLFFIFSLLGLSLAYLLQLSLQISAAKKKSIVLGYAAEIGQKQAWDQMKGLINERGFPLVLSEDRWAELRETLATGGGPILEEALGAGPPFSLAGRWENQSWETETRFTLERTRESGRFFVAGFDGLMVARGTIPQTRGVRTSSAALIMEVAAGYVPLSSFPLLVDRPSEPEDIQSYAQKHHLTLTPPGRGLVIPLLNFAQPGLLPQDACRALSETLKIKLFRPQDLTVQVLRQTLNLEPSPDPVPEGVYLIRTDLGLGGIYVQGDLEELILAVDEDCQVLCFRSNAGAWMLRFNPRSAQTWFSTPAETLQFSQVPGGTIAVNGKIRSLGGGRRDGDGGFVLCPGEETPCLLHGMYLTIVSSDTLTLTSHLIRQGVTWQNGIPYLKEADSGLTLFSTGRDFLSDNPTEGGVVIGREAPRDLKIEASLVAPGRGFLMDGEDKTVRVAGSIQASNIQNETGSLMLTYDPADQRRGVGDISAALPETTQPVLLVRALRIRKWSDSP